MSIKEELSTKNHSIIITSNIEKTNKIINENPIEGELTPLFINNYIDKFNTVSENLIIDYNYEIIDKKTIHVIILMKHIFSKLQETQKYFKAVINISDNEITITRNDKIKLQLSNKLSSKIEPLYINYIKITNAIDNTNNVTTVNFITDDDISNYKNFDLLFIFVKKLLNKLIDNVYI